MQCVNSSYYEKFFDGKSRCINNKIPFDLPDGWEYERLGNICTVARGGSPRPIEAFLTNDDNGLNWIKIGDTEHQPDAKNREHQVPISSPDGILLFPYDHRHRKKGKPHEHGADLIYMFLEQP